jgi:hypothetical protein
MPPANAKASSKGKSCLGEKQAGIELLRNAIKP